MESIGCHAQGCCKKGRRIAFSGIADLYGRASVSEKTCKKVEKAARELGYSPNILARSLTTRRTKLIGLVVSNFHNPLFLEIFDRFTRVLQERGLRTLLVNLSGEVSPQSSVQMLQQYSVDGVIVASSTLPPGFAVAFKKAGLPVVNTFGRHSAHPEVHVVGIDNHYAGVTAARTLIAHGYQSIGFLGGPENATSTQDRQAGFMEAMAAAGRPVAAVGYADEYAYAAGRVAMKALIVRARLDAVFCGDDIVGMGAISAVRDAGLAIPEEMGLIGFNGMEMASWQSFQLSTIQQPIQDIITSSVDLIMAIIDDPQRIPESRLFPCRVIERQSLRRQLNS